MPARCRHREASARAGQAGIAAPTKQAGFDSVGIALTDKQGPRSFGSHFGGAGMSDEALFAKGLPIRREVLGADYVDAAMAQADDFMMAFQRATTAWAWGWAWGRPGLDRKIRSMLNLAM